MGKGIISKLKKQGKVKGTIPLHKFLELNLDDPNDVAEYYKFILLDLLHQYMLKRNISQSDLARKLNISRQGVSKKFSGVNLSIDWIVRAFVVLGSAVNFSIPDDHSLYL